MIPKPKTPRSWRCSVCQSRNLGSLKTCPGCKTRRGTMRKSLSSRCDKLWADYIKSGGKCEADWRATVAALSTPCMGGLEAAHIIGRAQRVVRWSLKPRNGLSLCHNHHRMFDTYRIDRTQLIEDSIGRAAPRYLIVKAQGVRDMDFNKVLRALKELTVGAEIRERVG